jgi:hypothetical protein
MAVLGAAGKMGRGISLVLSAFLAESKIDEEVRSKSSATRTLTLIDVNDESFPGLLRYLRQGLRGIAEKKILLLRNAYSSRQDLVENGEMIEEFVDEAMASIRVSGLLESAKETDIVFEAVPEDVTLKKEILARSRTKPPNAKSKKAAIPAMKMAQRHPGYLILSPRHRIIQRTAIPPPRTTEYTTRHANGLPNQFKGGWLWRIR